MLFIDLFNIIYTDPETKNKYESIVNNIKVQHFLEFNTNISKQFTILISKNISYNKSYNKLKLEFHNINKNSINNDVVINVLSKIQHIINSNNIVSESDHDIVSESDPESILIEPEIEEEIKLIVSEKEYLQFHLFQNKYTENGYDNTLLKYITSFQLNIKINIIDEFNINHSKFGIFDMSDSDQLKVNSHIYNNKLLINYISDLDYYNKFFKTCSYYGGDSYDIIHEYLQDFDICDDYLLKNINKIMSGYYLNYNDVSLQIIMKLVMLSIIGDYGNTHKMLSFHNYVKETTYVNYFEYEKEYELNLYDNLLLSNLNIMCDNCDIEVLNDEYYHSDIGGDLCDTCYNKKKAKFYERIKYLKNKILSVGKNEIFKKEIIKTREFLGKKKYKLKKKSYYKLLETINKNLLEINSTQNICKICYQPLKTDIYVGSECGHCFHKSCLYMCNSKTCQLCRVDTNFVRLFL
jgi:hypothetical protein